MTQPASSGWKWRREHSALLLIIVTPMALVALATFIFLTGIGLPEGTRNQGVLLQPSISLAQELRIKPQTVYYGKQHQNSWRFAVLMPAVCDKSCEEQLWFARQVRIALGKYSDRIVNTALVQSNDTAQAIDKYQPYESFPVSQEIRERLKAAHGLDDEQVQFYLIDPQGLAMMVYSRDHSYRQVIKDMKFLLKGVE